MPPFPPESWTLHLPKELVGWVTSQPWLAVSASPRAALVGGTRVIPLGMHSVPPGGDLDLYLARLGNRSGPSAGLPGAEEIPLLTAPYLKLTVRAHLERLGFSYLDAKGHLHLSAPGVLLHLEGARARRPASAGAAALSITGVRIVQALLGHAQEVSVASLAQEARVSASNAHRTLSLLEEEGHVRTYGSGPMRRRTVVNRGALLEWLARQPTARKRSRRVDAAVYARTPQELWQRVRRLLDEKGIAHALTGAAAASVMGVGATSIPLSLVRVSPEVPLEEAAASLGAVIAERGANLTLIRDDGLVGTTQSELRDEVRLAPSVRVYLDLLAERRGEDQAEHFREVVLGF